jgi:hypothetical protein
VDNQNQGTVLFEDGKSFLDRRSKNSIFTINRSDDIETDGTVFELKFNTLPESASKADKYQWYLCLGKKRYDLDFKRMENGIRYFTLPKNSKCIKEILIDVDKLHMVIVYESSAMLYILTTN